MHRGLYYRPKSSYYSRPIEAFYPASYISKSRPIIYRPSSSTLKQLKKILLFKHNYLHYVILNYFCSERPKKSKGSGSRRILNHGTERNAENHGTERNIRITEWNDRPTAITLKPPSTYPKYYIKYTIMNDIIN